jgi:PIN domain nuclease of toxin-antitoxin system
MTRAALAAIQDAAAGGGVYASVASAWEIGMLCRPRLARGPALTLLPDPKTWFQRFIARPGVKLAAITPEIAIDASFLPGEVHGDPGDRLILATAQHLGVPVVTRDRRMVEYGGRGLVSVVRC